MIKRILTLVAATALLAACETASTTDSSATSSSATTATSGTSTSTSTATSTTATAAEAETPAEMMKREFTKVGTTILFDFDSSQISDYARTVLDRQAAFLKAQPEARIILGGHADERGTREYNLALGERRAAAARDYLVAKGVNSARIRIISYGKERPAAVGSNEAAWRLNRRAESVLN